MAKDEDFGLQRSARPKQLGHKTPNQPEEIDHRTEYRPIRRQRASCFGFAVGTAPQRVLFAHPLDKIAQFTAHSGSPWPTARFPAPVGPKSSSMPPQDRVRLNDAGQTEQAWPEPGHPYQQRPVTPTKPLTVRCTPQRNVELMPEKDVLDFKPAPRPEQVRNKRPKQLEDRKHHAG